MAEFLTFENIYQTVMKSIGDAQYARSDEVKSVVNMVYSEILHADDLYPPFWLMEIDDSKKSRVRAGITSITKANPAVITKVAHGFLTGDIITFYEVLGMVELNYRTFVIVRDSADAYHLHDFSDTNVDSTGFTTHTAGSGYAHHRGIALSDCERILYANWHGYNKGMIPIGPEQLETESSWWDVSRSRPLKYQHKQVYTGAGAQLDYFLWFQAPDAAYNLRLWYLRQVPRLSATGDVPMMPPQFHDAIIAGAIVRLGENKVQVEAGVVWPAIYNALIESIKTFNRKWWEENKPFERGGYFLI